MRVTGYGYASVRLRQGVKIKIFAEFELTVNLLFKINTETC